MADLYFTRFSCGAATYISAKYGGYKFNKAVIVDLATHTLVGTKEDFYKINPKGNVPTLVLGDGTILNENCATLYYVASHSPKKNLLGSSESEQFQILNAVAFIATELHKGCYSPMFGASRTGDEATKKTHYEGLKSKLDLVKKFYFKDGKAKYLVGDKFSIADAYFYMTCFWCGFLQLDLPDIAKEYKDFIEANVKEISQAFKEMEEIENKAKTTATSS